MYESCGRRLHVRREETNLKAEILPQKPMNQAGNIQGWLFREKLREGKDYHISVLEIVKRPYFLIIKRSHMCMCVLRVYLMSSIQITQCWQLTQFLKINFYRLKKL